MNRIKEHASGNGSTAVLERPKGKAAPKEKPAPKSTVVTIPDLDIQIFKLRVVGDSSLIMNRMTAKAREKLGGKLTGTAAQPDEKRSKKEIFEDSLYKFDSKVNGCNYYMPSGAFRGAAVSACTSLGKSVATKTGMRQFFQVVEDNVPIKGEPKLREDIGRNPSTKGAVVLYRGEFEKWSAEFHVRYNARVITPAQIINLFNTAGFAVGIGEWRPEKNGNHGMFHVEL